MDFSLIASAKRTLWPDHTRSMADRSSVAGSLAMAPCISADSIDAIQIALTSLLRPTPRLLSILATRARVRETRMRYWQIVSMLSLASVIGGTASAAPPVPELVTRDGRSALMVDGAPYLILGAQVNNSSSWPSMLPKVWPAVKKLQANTVSVAMPWEQIEPARASSISHSSTRCCAKRASRKCDWCCCGSPPGKTTALTTLPSG